MAATGNISDDEDDVPPLEDVSDMIQNLSELRKQANVAKSKSDNPFLEASEDAEIAKVHSIQKLLGKAEEKPKAIVSEKQDAKVPVLQPRKVETGFAGFKKGFLLGNTSRKDAAKKPAAPKKDMPKLEEIKKTTTDEKRNPYVFSEVQEALAAQMPLLQSKEWITEDLLSKVEKNPKLLKQLENPKFSQALAAFQSNPKEATSLMQNDPEVREFIQEFCALLGQHFTIMGEQEENQKKASRPPETLEASSSRRFVSGSHERTYSNDEEKFKQIISDPSIQEILSDSRIQNLISALKENPSDAQRIIAGFGPELHGKIQRLIEAGLLGVSRR